MPQVTVFVRNKDLKKWRAIEKKAEFIHLALQGKLPDVKRVEKTIVKHPTKIIEKILKKKSGPGSRPEREKVPPPYKSVLPKVLQVLHPTADLSRRFEGPLCKEHGVPLDNRLKCTQVGCKYA